LPRPWPTIPNARSSAEPSRPAPDRRLLVSLPQDRCPARLGPGARAVALTSAAHAGRVALSWPARSGRRPRAGRGARGVCSARSSGALPARQPGDGSNIGGSAWTEWSLAWTRTNAPPRSR
jgi:hypothetical protein